MKIVLVAIAATLFAAAPAGATPECAFGAAGLYSDAQGYRTCNVETDLYVTVELPFMYLQSSQAEVTELRFRLENMPVSGVGGIVTYNWLAQSVSGDPETGLILTFDPPLSGDQTWQTIGAVTLFPLEENWPGTDHAVWTYGESSRDSFGEELLPVQQLFIFNLSDGGDGCCVGCAPAGPWIYARDFYPVQGDYIGDSFNFEFTAEGYYCSDLGETEPRAFTGRVLVEGEPVETLDGAGTQDYAFTLGAGDVPPGEILHVTVELELETGQTQNAQLRYVVSTSTGIPELQTFPISIVKGLYR